MLVFRPSDIHSKDGVQEPSFARATHCAAIFAAALKATEEGSADYDASVEVGTAWLKWARQIAEGRDADSAMDGGMDGFTQRVTGKSPEDASAELSKEIKACQTVKTMMAGTEPFATVYDEAVTGKPGFNTAVDCLANSSFIAQTIRKKDPKHNWFDDGVETWGKYAEDIRGRPQPGDHRRRDRACHAAG
ncbi:MAG: hypothetical protein J7496_10940 [Novosphingobium sp.]|nr:hypothetical protein [Novosphingobium sp.]MBO9603009.1 hypothetical protein [Novosphingobium sp.]